MKASRIITAGLVGMALATAAQASVNFGTATGYSVFATGNATIHGGTLAGGVAGGSNVDMDSVAPGGTVVAGKNLNMDGGNSSASLYAGGNAIIKNAGISGALYTGGNANVNGGTISGGVYYDGKYNGPSYISHQSASYAQPLDFSAAGNEFSGYSSALAGMASTGSVTSQWGGITLTGNSATTSVFNIDSSIFTGAWGLTINAPTSSNIVINITGSSVNMNLTMNTNGISASNIVLNCYEAKSVNISNSSIFGTVLATDATTVFNGGNLTGSVITDNYVAHNVGMNGNGYSGAGITPAEIAGAIASVPEPATVSGLALMGIVLLCRSGRKKK